ncbi:hypothetical protein M0802_013431 [Mischocyttarus mexicanus]|nr:hypothetical protein M0802_013431 [Mischocyttarus mexicanus]
MKLQVSSSSSSSRNSSVVVVVVVVVVVAIVVVVIVVVDSGTHGFWKMYVRIMNLINHDHHSSFIIHRLSFIIIIIIGYIK